MLYDLVKTDTKNSHDLTKTDTKAHGQDAIATDHEDPTDVQDIKPEAKIDDKLPVHDQHQNSSIDHTDTTAKVGDSPDHQDSEHSEHSEHKDLAVALDEKPAVKTVGELDSGKFVVTDKNGQVSIDFLSINRSYRGQLGIFSLSGLENYDPNSPEFIKEAATRALSNSTLGGIAIDDHSQGARFGTIDLLHE